MAVLSLIVPVYGVEQYLRECLDSILSQTGPGWTGGEIEVVAVDDRSPDGSAAILAAYAARDCRVRVVTHATNQGLGAARNTGLEHATGEYVWFVDSDDWVTPGALDAVVTRVTRTRPDVLVVGYDRRYDDGRVVPERLLPPGPDLPEIFTVREQPRLLRSLHIACNKIVRREFLTAIGVRFEPGWYEDVSFSHPLLLAAGRVGVLDRVCYGYRQRPEGQITRTRAERHTEVFEHWHLVMAFVDEGHEDLRPLVFQRMIWHYLRVLNHPHRVHRRQRRAFFSLVVRDYRRYRPPQGYPGPGGVARVTFALVALNAFALFEVLRGFYRTRTWPGAGLRALCRAGRRGYYRLQRYRSLTDEAAVYAGASHQGYVGAPHARDVASVFEEAHVLTQGAREVLIAGAVPDGAARDGVVPDGVVPSGSRRALRAFARARLLLSDVDLPAGIVPRPSQQVIRLAAPAEDGESTVVPVARAPDTPDHAHVT